MVLYNELIVLKEYPKKTKYDFWKDICIGDKLIVGITISLGTCFRGNSYQNKMMVRNVNSNTEFVNYPASVLKYLSNLDLQMVNTSASNIETVISKGMSTGYKEKNRFSATQLVNAFTTAFSSTVQNPFKSSNSSLPF